MAGSESASESSAAPHDLARQRPADPYTGPDAVSLWILVCCGLVFAMVLLGGYTRLTHSGLSMVEWKPLSVVPPLNEAEWEAEFELYQAFPEFRIQNPGMTLDGFRSIYLVEYSHRMLGRLLGFAFLLPFVWFWIRGRIDSKLRLRLIGTFALGGAQGVMGWYMVKSGLVDDPRVSPYRLTAHLMLAFLIHACLLSLAMHRIWPIRTDEASEASPGRRLLRHARLVTAIVVVMVVSGGFVAGNHAGLGYNTFPTMNGDFVPPGLIALEPMWSNLFENPTTVQFNHRWMFVVVSVAIVSLWIRARFTVRTRVAWTTDLLVAALALQVFLGIMTLLQAVPVSLGVLHQGGAFVLFSATLLVSHRLRTESPH